MAKESVESFLKKELGVDSLKILNKFLILNDLTDIAEASPELKEKFVAEIQPEFNQKSHTRAKFLSVELMSILGLKQRTTGADEAEKIKQQSIKKFLHEEADDRLLKSFSKVEAIYNLFWSKAALSSEKGVDEKTIRERCDNILGWLKSDLFSVCEELETNLGVEFKEKKTNKKSKFKFVDSQLSIEKKKSPYYYMFEDFRNKIEASYSEFYTVFMESMNKDIELAKRKESDAELIAETQKKTGIIWKGIIAAFDDLKKTVDSSVVDDTEDKKD